MTSDFDLHNTASNSTQDLFEAFQPSNIARLIVSTMQESAASRHRGFVSDANVIQNCISHERLQRVPETRVSRLYLASFTLRHAAVWLALFCERLNQNNPFLELKMKGRSPFSFLEKQSESFVLSFRDHFAGIHLSLTARGIEWLRKPLSFCSQFDAYASTEDAGCTSPPLQNGGFCERHVRQVWFHDACQANADLQNESIAAQKCEALSVPCGLRAQVTARHDTMMEFYSNFTNLLTYTQAELDEMVQQFFRRIKQHLVIESVCTEWAVQEFNFTHFEELRTAGPHELRKRYRKRSLEIHPDLGGDTEAFQKMQTAYGLLMSLLGP